MLTALGVLAAALVSGFILRQALHGITVLSPKIGKPAVVALDFAAAVVCCLPAPLLMLFLNDGVFVPFTAMFFFLGTALARLGRQQHRHIRCARRGGAA